MSLPGIIRPTANGVQSPSSKRSRDSPYRRKKSATKSLALHAIQRDGFPRPDAEGYTKIPHAFDAIVAEESAAVIRVVYGDPVAYGQKTAVTRVFVYRRSRRHPTRLVRFGLYTRSGLVCRP
jgi:hypothetical protein